MKKENIINEALDYLQSKFKINIKYNPYKDKDMFWVISNKDYIKFGKHLKKVLNKVYNLGKREG